MISQEEENESSKEPEDDEELMDVDTPRQMDVDEDADDDLQQAFSPGTVSNRSNTENSPDTDQDGQQSEEDMVDEAIQHNESNQDKGSDDKKQSPVSFQPKNSVLEERSIASITDSLSIINDQLGDFNEHDYNRNIQKHALMESLKAGEMLLNFGLDNNQDVNNDHRADEDMEDEFAQNQLLFN